MPRKEYFSHDYDSREDDKITDLLSKLGYEGYGVYWAVVETLYKSGGYLQLNYNSISFVLHCRYKILQSVINDFNLFKFDGDKVYSEAILTRLNLRKELSKKRSDAVKNRYLYNSNTNDVQLNNNSIRKRKINSKENNNINIITKEVGFDPLESEKKISENEFELLNSHAWIEGVAMQYGLAPQEAADMLFDWINEMKLKELMTRELSELKRHFVNTVRGFKKDKKNGHESFTDYASKILRSV